MRWVHEDLYAPNRVRRGWPAWRDRAGQNPGAVERDLWKVPEPEVADVLNSTENSQTTWGVREKARVSG